MAGTTYTRFGTYNAVLPKAGPTAYPFTLDFRSVGNAEISLQNEITLGHIDFISGVYVDNSANDNPLDIVVASTNQKVTIPPKSQAYMPLCITDTATLSFKTVVDNQLLVPIQVVNFPVQPCVWKTTA